MNPITTSLLKINQADAIERTKFCPDDEQFSAWFEGRLGASEKERLVQHTMGCAYCRSRLGVLGRLEEVTDNLPVDGELLASAKRLGASQVAAPKRWVALWAAAAAMVLAIGVTMEGGFLRNWSPEEPVAEPTGAAVSPAQLRRVDMDAVRPTIIQPAAEARLAPGSLEVRWTPVPEALHYELLLLSDAGELLLQRRVEDTHWEMEGGGQLRAGARYFVRVNAYLADGRTEGSGHISFSIGQTAEDGG